MRPLRAIFINSTPLMSEKTKWRRKIWLSIAGVVGRCIMKYQSPIEVALIIPASRYFFIFTSPVNVCECVWLWASNTQMLAHTWIKTHTHTQLHWLHLLQNVCIAHMQTYALTETDTLCHALLTSGWSVPCVFLYLIRGTALKWNEIILIEFNW